MTNPWTERDPESEDRPREIPEGTVIDIQWTDGRIYAGAPSQSVFWKNVSRWRVSELSEQAGTESSEKRLFGRTLSWEERIETMRKLDQDVFGGQLLSEPTAEGLHKRAVDILKGVSTDPEAARSIYEKLKKSLGELQGPLDKGGPRGDSYLDKILSSHGPEHTGGPDCPACAASESPELSPEEEAERERLKLENEKMVALVHQTPELLRWARLFAGNIWVTQCKADGSSMVQATVKAMAYITGDLDQTPEVRGAIDALAVLLRDDTDFAVFRRTKLDGRSGKVNSVLDEMERVSRSMVRVVSREQPETKR